MSERDYIRGSQAAWRRMLVEVNLNLEDGNRTENELRLELSDARAALRDLANAIGGGLPGGHLGDVVRKYLTPDVLGIHRALSDLSAI